MIFPPWQSRAVFSAVLRGSLRNIWSNTDKIGVILRGLYSRKTLLKHVNDGVSSTVGKGNTDHIIEDIKLLTESDG